MPELGRAALFTLLADGRHYVDIFTEGELPDDPERCAERALAAAATVEPDAMFSIAVNERARDLMMGRRMRALGFSDLDYSPMFPRERYMAGPVPVSSSANEHVNERSLA